MSVRPNDPIEQPLSKTEPVKAASNHLRGTIAEDLSSATPVFGEGNVQLLKFHGIYQQDDRDRRREARERGQDKHYQMMIRTRIPGGVVSADGYLAHDAIARDWGDGTMRVTTRQAFQLHGVLKGDLRDAIRSINATLLTTLGGCGDQSRNIMTCPAPVQSRFHSEVQQTLAALVPALTASTGAYHEIWLDGERAETSKPESEPLYGDTYLPRKFKLAVALEGDNCVDVYADDLGFVARRDGDRLAGFEVLVGGGLGRTRNKPDTYAAVAMPLGGIDAGDAVAVARAVVAVHRDHGDRTNRRHARVKYLLRDRGVEWFRDQVEQRSGVHLSPPRPLDWGTGVPDHLGWHDQGEGLRYLGIHVESGRIADREDAQLRTALRTAVERLRPGVLLTPQQNVILAALLPSQQAEVDSILADHGVLPLAEHGAVRNALACPAWPTCGLATAEAERVLPSLIRRFAGVLDALGLGGESISVRMTGCPNGCARPYLGDIGLVGTTVGKYDVFLGGDVHGTRLSALYADNVPMEHITTMLEAVLRIFRDERARRESFGDWVHRAGLVTLRDRLEVPAPIVKLPLHAIAGTLHG